MFKKSDVLFYALIGATTGLLVTGIEKWIFPYIKVTWGSGGAA